MVRDLDTQPPQSVELPGPAGRLHAIFEAPRSAPRGVLLLLHPHPLGGGTARNNVVRHGALGGLEADCATLRLDFRGAGGSEGVHDEGVGEVDDAAAALAWLRRGHAGVPAFLWGFSFGARVGLDLALRGEEELAGYLGVAWPTRMLALPQAGAWPERMALLVGDRDEYADPEVLQTFAADHGARFELAAGASHFFEGDLARVRAFTADALRSWL